MSGRGNWRNVVDRTTVTGVVPVNVTGDLATQKRSQRLNCQYMVK